VRRAALVVLLALAGCGGTAAAAHRAAPTPTAAAPSASASAAPVRLHAGTAGWRLAEPSARQAVVALGGGEVLVAGGMLPGDSSTGRVRRLDLATGRGTDLAPLAVAVHDAAGGTYAGAPAVFGGGNATEQSLVQRLEGRTWRRVDAFSTTRSDLSVLVTGHGTLALGGYDGTHVPTTDYLQQGMGPMRPFGALVRGVRYAATAVVGDAAYVFGGEVDHAELDTVQRIDLRTGRARVVARLPHPLGHAMAATVGDRVLLVGGDTAPDRRTARMWWFDPAGRRFSPAGRLPRPLSDAAVVVDAGTVWLLGGEDPEVTDRVVRISPRS
jgi:hypothetical protein